MCIKPRRSAAPRDRVSCSSASRSASVCPARSATQKPNARRRHFLNFSHRRNSSPDTCISSEHQAIARPVVQQRRHRAPAVGTGSRSGPGLVFGEGFGRQAGSRARIGAREDRARHIDVAGKRGTEDSNIDTAIRAARHGEHPAAADGQMAQANASGGRGDVAERLLASGRRLLTILWRQGRVG